MSCRCNRSLILPYGVMDWTVVCNCGINYFLIIHLCLIFIVGNSKWVSLTARNCLGAEMILIKTLDLHLLSCQTQMKIQNK